MSIVDSFVDVLIDNSSFPAPSTPLIQWYLFFSRCNNLLVVLILYVSARDCLLAMLAANGDARLAADVVMRVLVDANDVRRRSRALALADSLHVSLPTLAAYIVERCVTARRPSLDSNDSRLRWLLSIASTTTSSTIVNGFQSAIVGALASDVVCGALMTDLCSPIEVVRSHAFALLHCAFTPPTTSSTTTTNTITSAITITADNSNVSATSAASTSTAIDEFGDSLGDSNRNRIRVLNGAIHRLHRCAMLNQSSTEYLKRFSKLLLFLLFYF